MKHYQSTLSGKGAIRAFAFIFSLMLAFCMPAAANTYVVTTASDNASGTNPAAGAGTGTLRQAIIDANTNAGADIITFNIAGGGLKVLTLLAELPFITGATAINGYTQPGAVQGAIGSRTIMIQVDGNSQVTGGGRPATFDGANGLFRFSGTASNSSMSGLSIVNTGDGVEPIEIDPNNANMHIWGNYIGVLASGASPASSADYNGDDDVFIGSYSVTSGSFSNIFIGTDGNGTNDANEGNVIANSAGSTGGDGIQIGYAISGTAYTYSNIRISGNYIGVAADGITAAPNGISATTTVTQGVDGINLLNTSNVLVGSNGDGTSDVEERNIISGNFGHGIDLTSGSNHRIGGNYIGTNKNGTAAVPNGKNTNASTLSYSGIFITAGVSNVIVGFDDATQSAAAAPQVRNIVSGNYGTGIQVNNNTATTNRISGNYIGVNATGNVSLGNGQGNLPVNQSLFVIGIDVTTTSNLLIGTDADGVNDNLERNIIGGQVIGRGIYIRNSSTGTIIAGNYIGVGADGVSNTGNETSGIIIDAVVNNRIGSNDDGVNDAAEANIIANNAAGTVVASSDGIRVIGNSTGNRISRNVFYNNKENPIDLNNDGVTLNDGTTTASSPNLLLDYPVITNYSLSGTTVNVSGYVSTCNGTEATAGAATAGNKTIQFYKVADDGDQNGALTNGSCTRIVSHGEGVQYLGSINSVVNSFNTSFTLVAGASMAAGDKLTAITIDAAGNTSEFGVLAAFVISGTVFNDANGLTDNTVNGTATNVGGTLNAVLVNAATGNVVAVIPVAANGTYSFTAVSGGNYNIVITTNAATVGSTAPAVALPAGWVSTGEDCCDNIGSDGAVNGTILLGTISSDVINANFGIEQPPTANNVTAATQQNPGGNAQVTVPTLNGTDPEDGTYNGTSGTNTVIIQTLPINGTLYYNGTAIIAGATIANYNPALLTVDPNNGITSITFTYSEVDAAGVASPAATVTMPFTTAAAFVCGNTAYHTKGPNSNVELFTYNMLTGTTSAPIVSFNALANALVYNPADNMLWILVTPFPSLSTGPVLNRVDANGVLTPVTVPNSAAVFNPNAINPTAGGVTSNGYYVVKRAANPASADYVVIDINPSRATYLQIVDPANSFAVAASPYYKTATAPLTIADLAYNSADGLFYGITSSGAIATLNIATGAYTVGNAITVNGTAAGADTYGSTFIDATGSLYAITNNGRSFRIQIPSGAAILLSSSGTSVTNTDGASCPAAVFSYGISGNVFNDVNGLSDNTVNGTGLNPGSLNAVLYDVTTGAVAAIVPVNADGTYNFAAAPGDNYSVYITTNTATVGQTAAPVVALPSGWVSTGEHLGAGTGSDGTVNGILPVGILTGNVTNANFGIEQPPTPGGGSNTANNPGGTIQVPVPANTFTNISNSTDPVTNTVTSIIITAIPAGATTIVINGIKYGPGFTAFPAAGVTVPTDATGNPTQLITVDPTIDGTTTVTIIFKAVDAAGVVSATTGTAVLNLTTAVPVRLISFTGRQVSCNTVELAWEVDNAISFSRFEVERSISGGAYNAVASVPYAAGLQRYNAKDAGMADGRWLYRLKMIDNDGTARYSNIVPVAVSCGKDIITVVPNPAVDVVKINSLKAGELIKIYDAAGRPVISRKATGYSESINVANLAAGMYVIRIEGGNAPVSVQLIKK